MAVTINADTSNGVIITPDTSGEIALQANGVTKATIGSNGLYSTGHVLQVLQAVKTDGFTTSSTSFIDITGLSISIVPSSTSSKILVIVDISASGANANFSIYNLVRTSTNLYQGTDAKTYVGSHIYFPGGDSTESIGTLHMCYLDSPSTTSSTTYKVQMRVTGSSAGVNRRTSANDTSLASSITVMEIAG